MTGASGFVGRALVRELVSNGVEVIAVERTGRDETVSDKLRIVGLDLTESKRLPDMIPDRDIDVFYHLAWTGVSGPLRSDIQVQLNNILMTLDCIKISKEIGAKKFVCAGSIMEIESLFVTNSQGYIPGDVYVNGSGIYGSCKYAAHSLGVAAAARAGVDLVWTRITNTYGPGERSKRFINTTLRKILNDEPLRFTAGTQNYDFIYIDDVAKAFRLIGEKGKGFSCYVIGGAAPKRLKEYILEIRDTLAPDKEFLFGDIPFTGANLPLTEYDSSLIEKDTGFRAEITFRDGIQRTMDWIKAAEERT